MIVVVANHWVGDSDVDGHRRFDLKTILEGEFALDVIGKYRYVRNEKGELTV